MSDVVRISGRVQDRRMLQLSWLFSAAITLLAAAAWMRNPSIPYVVGAVIATTVTLTVMVIGARRGSSRERGPAIARWSWGFVASAIVFSALALRAERDLSLMRRDLAAFDQGVHTEAMLRLTRDLRDAADELQQVAAEAVRAPSGSAARFDALNRAIPWSWGRGAEGGVVLFSADEQVAWAGVVRVSGEEMRQPVGVQMTTFYTVLFASVTEGQRRAVAMRLLHAEPPADGLARPLDREVAHEMGITGFEFWPEGRDGERWQQMEVAPGVVLSARPVARLPGMASQRLLERSLVAGGLTLAVALVAFLAAAWRRPSRLRRRMASLGVALAVVAVVPLSSFSNISRIFDPAVYFAAIGGPFTANAAALAISSALVLLGFFTLQRLRARVLTRGAATAAVVGIVALGPFLLRDLARGVSPPPHGVTTMLWLSWQVAMFLAAAATLLAGVSAGRAALGTRRGLHPALGPSLAALSALAGPLLWRAPGNWPGWFPIPWIIAMALLALSRRSRAVVVSAAVVAACGATTLVWGATARKRVELAERDVARLSQPDSAAIELLQRFSESLAAASPPVEREELLQRYVRSDLASGGYPVELASWLPRANQPYVELIVAAFEREREGERALVEEARIVARPIIRLDSTQYGIQTALAVPHSNGGVTTVVVAPRTLLIPNDPYMSLIGLGDVAAEEPPYEVTLTQLDEPSTLPPRPRWQRTGSSLHGDAKVTAASRPARVHLEVELRGLDALLPRGALIVVLDLLILGSLWTLAVAADAGLGRWLRYRLRRFMRSYRARLTITLFSFFALPAGIFAWWSYERLQTSDRQSRELLVRETLRAIEATGDPLALAYESGRLRTPLFLFNDGTLRAASDPLYERLSPVGRFLPPLVALGLAGEDEVDASAWVRLGERTVLFGYRAILGFGEGAGTVLAAPARVNEFALDRQRRDLGILVLFALALGGTAALWLSGLAARELGRPIGALREAALRIARGERHPDILIVPPAEFVPVFSAFRRMDDDLTASREALEEAQRRTDAVLRNVASGVIAVDREGRITMANTRAERLLGRTLPAGTAVADVAPPAMAARAQSFLNGTETDASFDLELFNRQMQLSLTRLRRGTGGAVITLDDVTELAHAQRVLAWGEMARQIAHEIKNPLTPIRLGVQHLRRARTDQRVDFARVFEQNVTRILAEIDRLDEIARTFSRYGMARHVREPAESVDVAEVVRDVVELERMGMADVSWTVEGDDAPAPAMARADELREVLLNVFENARQAHARNVRVMLSHPGGQVRIAVHDDGAGIPEEVLPKIFEPHFSTHTSGSGLGLAISRGLVRAWGGEMRVDSKVGEGTNVLISLVATPTT